VKGTTMNVRWLEVVPCRGDGDAKGVTFHAQISVKAAICR
jgi:hypothetical protein